MKRIDGIFIDSFIVIVIVISWILQGEVSVIMFILDLVW
jgi:hypothetical protein